MDVRQVITVDDIIFEAAGITLPAGTRYSVEAVTEDGIILYNENDRYMIDLVTFENGFAAVG